MQSHIGRVGVCWWYEEMAVDMEWHLGDVELVEDDAERHRFVVGERDGQENVFLYQNAFIGRFFSIMDVNTVLEAFGCVYERFVVDALPLFIR